MLEQRSRGPKTTVEPYPILLLTFFFFNDTATTEIYTLSLHDALPICVHAHSFSQMVQSGAIWCNLVQLDRKSTRLNSSHSQISYAVFCLKKNSASHRAIRQVLTFNLTTSNTSPTSSLRARRLHPRMLL